MSSLDRPVIVRQLYRLFIPGLLLIGGLVFSFYLLDQHLHRKFDKIATVNQAGYRGPLAGAKLPGERRIFLMGGSTALGYGVLPDETIAAYLEQLLNVSTNVRYSVINLGFNNTGAAAFIPDLRSYSSLQPDVVIFYTGSGDLKVNPYLGRHESVVFRMTGYYPILPLIVSEKAKLIRYHSLGRWSQYKTVYRLGEKTQPAPRDSTRSSLNHWDWTYYCSQMKKAISFALGQNKQVIVVAEPDPTAQHADQQKALKGMLDTEFSAEPRVTYVDFGLALGAADKGFTLDGLHLTAEGNRVIAEKLAPLIQKVFDETK